MKSCKLKLSALILAAFMLTAALTACQYSIGINPRHTSTTAPWSGTAVPNHSVVYTQTSTPTGSSGTAELNAAEKALLGTWMATYSQGTVRDAYDWSYLYAAGIGMGYSFYEDRTFTGFLIMEDTTGLMTYSKGIWSADENTIYMSNMIFQDSKDRGKTWSDWRPYATPDSTMDYYHGVNEEGRAFIDKPSDVDDRTGRLYKQQP